MADLDPRLGEMATEDGTLLRPTVERSRNLPPDNVVSSTNHHGPVAPGCGLEFLVFGHEHDESSIWHDDVDRS
ncbi:hypothetical protein Pyn_19009 [Prunus yedoensis var. nudiflora]|uniref:Uncharacterized protein n=1 Tax=Prunus yedoensis var. nudiflora TaxID=2094558 RepID=A0A315ANB7_PRUYE|nr:hypothetical protein Pyn_19009 [Prunus yedoensis var. nudiflora]